MRCETRLTPEFLSKVAAGFEVSTLRAFELAAIVVQCGTTVRAGAFDFLEIGLSGAGRHGVCRLAALYRNIPLSDPVL